MDSKWHYLGSGPNDGLLLLLFKKQMNHLLNNENDYFLNERPTCFLFLSLAKRVLLFGFYSWLPINRLSHPLHKLPWRQEKTR